MKTWRKWLSSIGLLVIVTIVVLLASPVSAQAPSWQIEDGDVSITIIATDWGTIEEPLFRVYVATPEESVLFDFRVAISVVGESLTSVQYVGGTAYPPDGFSGGLRSGQSCNPSRDPQAGDYLVCRPGVAICWIGYDLCAVTFTVLYWRDIYYGAGLDAAGCGAVVAATSPTSVADAAARYGACLIAMRRTQIAEGTGRAFRLGTGCYRALVNCIMQYCELGPQPYEAEKKR